MIVAMIWSAIVSFLTTETLKNDFCNTQEYGFKYGTNVEVIKYCENLASLQRKK